MKLFPEILGSFPEGLHALLTTYWEHLGADPGMHGRLCRLFDADPGLLRETLTVWAGSDYVAGLCTRKPALLLELLESGDLEKAHADWPAHLAAQAKDALAGQYASSQEFEAGLKVFLRRFRQREMTRIIWRDLTGKAGLEETCLEMSAMADAILQFALEALHPWCCREMGEPRAADGSLQQMVVIAMGKYGARELNLSSDIDLIFAFPENGETVPPADGAQHGLRVRTGTIQNFFIRLGQRLIDAIESRTEEGFVFRVDMRLRPYGGSGALALSFGAMEEYYQSQGRDWERFAMLKARAAAGDVAGGERLMAALRPFVYRRYLDFAAIDALRDMKRQIRRQVQRRGMEDNIKLGEGGIREVEFIVQVFQLIHGGRNPELQGPSLLRALEALAREGYLEPGDADDLRQCYFHLRRLEHRLQALNDTQTQKLPAEAESRARVAFAMGCASWEDLSVQLKRVRDIVARHFREVIAEPEPPAETPAAQTETLQALWREELDEQRADQILRELRYAEPEKLRQSIHAYRASRQYLSLEKIAQERVNRFMGVLLLAASRAERPDLAFHRVFSFMEHVARRTAYLVLLLENELALRQLVDLCHASPWIVECLSKYPVLLDELLKPISVPPVRDALCDDLRQQLLRVPEEDYDQQLDVLRYFKLVHVLRVAASDLAETLPLMKVSDYLTYIAEALLEQVVALAWQFLTARHGFPVNSRGQAGGMDFCVIAYGKLGGIELSYGSDLDVVFLHDGSGDSDTRAAEGQQPVNSRGFYLKLGQRIINMLTTTTISGKLYEVDLRLRPSGAAGLLVSSLEAYEHYQRNDAWTWEHQALVRTRVVTGDPALSERFKAVRAAVLRLERDDARLRGDICKMRNRMRLELGTPVGSPLFDIKQDTGALVDIEFIVQYMVLAHARRYEELVTWSDNMRLLETIARLGLIEEGTVRTLMEIYIRYRSRLHRLALQNESPVLPRAEYQEERETVTRIWHELFPEQEQT